MFLKKTDKLLFLFSFTSMFHFNTLQKMNFTVKDIFSKCE